MKVLYNNEKMKTIAIEMSYYITWLYLNCRSVADKMRIKRVVGQRINAISKQIEVSFIVNFVYALIKYCHIQIQKCSLNKEFFQLGSKVYECFDVD